MSFSNKAETGYKLKASFEQADGIKQGSDVKVSGIKVGEVISTKLNDDFLAKGDLRSEAVSAQRRTLVTSGISRIALHLGASIDVHHISSIDFSFLTTSGRAFADWKCSGICRKNQS